MPNLIKPKQINPSLINGYVLTTSGSTVLWAPVMGSTSGNCQSNFYVENIWGCDTDGVILNNTNYIDFLLLTASPVHSEGRVHWLDDTKTISIDTDQTGVSIELGHQNVVRVVNNTGSVLQKGRIVYVTGGSGGNPEVSLANYTTDPTSARSLGFVVEPIPATPNSKGYVITYGLLRGTTTSPLNTNAYPVGTQLYLYTGGTWTSTKPIAPLHEVRIGQVVRQNANTGVIFVTVQNGYELNELHDVYYTTPVNGDILRWVSANTRWETFPTSSLGFVGGTGTTNYGAMFTPNGGTVGNAPIKFADTVTRSSPINTTTNSIGIGYDIVMTGGTDNFFIGYDITDGGVTNGSVVLGNRLYIDPTSTVNYLHVLGDYNFVTPSTSLFGIYLIGDSNYFYNSNQFSSIMGENNTLTDVNYFFLGGIGNNINNVYSAHIIGDGNTSSGLYSSNVNILGSSNTFNNNAGLSILGDSNNASNLSNSAILGSGNLSPLSNEITIGFNDTGARLTTTGDMSIGLATPTAVSAKLEVKGNGNTSGTYALKVDNSLSTPLVHIRDDGYVGIGTTSPTEKLEIFDSSAPTVLKTFINNSLSSGYAELMMQTDISDMRFGTGGSASTPYSGSPGDCYFGAVSNSNLILATNNTVRMNIRNTGEVGINTGNASLTSQLQVIGAGNTFATYTSKFLNSSSAEILTVRDDRVVNINEQLRLNGGNGFGSVLSIYQPSFTQPIMDVYNNDYSSALFRILSSGTNQGEVNIGNFGLNVNAANSRVELGFYSGVYNRKLDVRAATPTEEIVSFQAYNATGSHYFAVSSNNPYYFMQDSAYTTTVLINSNGNSFFNGGNVGIGTTPSATLDVVGTFQYVDGSQASGYVLTSDANGNATWQSTSGFTGGNNGPWTAGTGTNSAVLIGNGGVASGNYAVAGGGVSPLAAGDGSFAFGESVDALGSYSVAFGTGGSTAYGQGSFVGGENSHAIGGWSFVFGSFSQASSNETYVFGVGITGTNTNTLYTPYLNVGLLQTGTSVTTLGIDSNGNVVAASGGGTFTGNTSADCITNLYVQNLNSCSPLYIQNISTGTILMGPNGGVDVGIGTPNPSLPAKLTVHTNGATSATYGLSLISTGGDTTFTVRDDSYVGIGTAAPTANLHIDKPGATILFAGGDGDIKYIKPDVTSGSPGTGGSHLYIEGGEAQSVGGTGGQTRIKGGVSSLGIGGDVYMDGGVGTTGADGNVYLGYNTTGSILIDGTLNAPQNSNAKLVVSTTNGFDQFRIVTPYTPTSSADKNGTVGSIAWDDSYIYVKTNTGWGRAKLEAF